MEFTDKDHELLRKALAFRHWALVDDAHDDPENAHHRHEEIDALEELNYRFHFIDEDEVPSET